ncbi:MFS transporter [Streptomyces sp. NBC_01450]|uniref:MFS transporter n=1 Tax=Streptomyces sp. NBC_01450 TaxID=2903871 RepID=UPI003FCCF92B
MTRLATSTGRRGHSEDDRVPRPRLLARLFGGFDVLRERNFRRFVTGQVLSLVGTWMQRVAQDWLVLELSGKDPVALGVATGLQFLPIVFLSLWAGVLADRVDVRRALIGLQTLMGLCALALGLLDVSGSVRLWHVYLLCLVLGCLSALDAPIFEKFVVEMVGKEGIAKAVALNSMTFNVARVVGPALAGWAIAWHGTGPVFLANAVSFAAVVVGLLSTDPATLHHRQPVARTPGLLRAGLRYAWGDPDLVLLLTLTLVVGVCASFGTAVATAAAKVFGSGAGSFGLLSTMLALGMLAGSVFSTLRGGSAPSRPRALVTGSAAALGALELAVGLMPNVWLFGLLLIGAGAAATVFVVTAHSTVQMSVSEDVRGRVMGLFMLVLLGGTPLGGPLTGWLADVLGGRAPFVLGGAAILLTAGGVAAAFHRRGERPPVMAPALETSES